MADERPVPLDERRAFERSVVEPAFDRAFYLAQLGPGAAAIGDPVEHYLAAGWQQLVDPSPDFSTAYYLHHNPDIRTIGINPFAHYLQWGRQEGRPSRVSVMRDGATARPNAPPRAATQAATRPAPVPGPVAPVPPTPATVTAPAVPQLTSAEIAALAQQRAVLAQEFDETFYAGQCPDLAQRGIDPVMHYLVLGWREFRDPSPRFSTRAYLDRYPDVREGGLNPLLHYIAFGRGENRVVDPSTIRPNLRNDERLRREAEVVSPWFDAGHYRDQSPGPDLSDEDAVYHYLHVGWREGFDPSPEFSTRYYLDSNPDVAASGLNPFVHFVAHGSQEQRHGLPFSRRRQRADHRPLVSVIVPNFNHARFLPERLESILRQTYTHFELIILDDASTDDSQAVIARYRDADPDRIVALFNDQNGGNVFLQWKRGLQVAKGDLVWICESDDFCEPAFLDRAVRPFADASVMMAFGRVQFADQHGAMLDGLDNYRNAAEAGIWADQVVRPACQWFRTAFAATNIIPNVGGCVFRNQPITDAVWADLAGFRICGDWFMYLNFAQGGRIAYVPTAIAYFRQHGTNTSVVGRNQRHYYAEHEEILKQIRMRWRIGDHVNDRMRRNVQAEYRLARADTVLGDFDQLYDSRRVAAVERTTLHILVVTLGFQLGGAELFPIYLANALVERGFTVSLLCIDSDPINPAVRALLDGRVAVYEQELVREMGREAFIENAGIDLIHTHNIGAEFLFFNERPIRMTVPYVVTLHGSYEVTDIPDPMLLALLRNVSHWVYLTDRNLGHLDGIPIERGRISHIPNGVPFDDRDSPVTRETLGIGSQDLVFTIASRAVPEKGWRQAVQALRAIGGRADRRLHLVLCGSGPEADAVMADPALPATVHVLGFQDRINAIYGWSDVVMLPTRFKGESFPLSIIQALQVGVPVIATDVGRIKALVDSGKLSAGLTINDDDDDARYTASLTAAMIAMTDDAFRASRRVDAARLGARFDMDHVVADYIDLYAAEMRRGPGPVPRILEPRAQ